MTASQHRLAHLGRETVLLARSLAKIASPGFSRGARVGAPEGSAAAPHSLLPAIGILALTLAMVAALVIPH